MSNLAFSLRDLTINVLLCVFYTARLAIRQQLKGESFFVISIAFMFLTSRVSIYQGYDQFSEKSRKRQEFFMSLSALIFDQLWPIYQWGCEEIDCVLGHGHDLFFDALRSRQ